MAVAVLSAPLILWSACTDTWGEHYDAVEGGMADQPSLLSNIADDPNLANFYKVVQEIGASDMLSSPQQLTVWAPLALTSAQADSVIAVYNSEVAANKETEDNKAMTQFLYNHIALYSRTVSALTNDTVAMLNGKYMHLVGTSSESGILQENPFSGAVICNNGILYKAENVQTFFPNIREYTELQSNMDSLTSFLTFYDEYELDENASVAGGVVDGKTVYLDSVTNLTNEMLTKYGYIQREDSTYYLIAPTDEVWAREYEKYYPYYTYDSSVSNADSLADVQTKSDIICGRIFNMSMASKYNYNPQDSLCNTQYSLNQAHNPRQNVYYKPESGILAGLEKVECSNGYVYIDNKGVIDPATTFFGRKDIEAYSSRYYEIPTNSNNEETMIVSQSTYYQQKNNGPVAEPDTLDMDTEIDDSGSSSSSDLDDEKSFNYAMVLAKTSSAQTQLQYDLPETFSNCYYNIYLVTVPDDQTHLPLWFQVSQNVVNANGTFPSSSTYFNNPHPITEDSEGIDNTDVILTQSNNGRCYVASAEKVDTILLQSAVKYSYSGVGLDDGVVQLTIGSFGPSSSSYRERVYTRTLRLNEIIMVPFETEEEALAAADDLDAFNDDILEANKEN